MKTLLQIIFIGLLSLNQLWSQKKYPFYEQIAFDFYRTKILVENPVNEKISIYKNFYNFHGQNIYFFDPTCLKGFSKNDFKSLEKLSEDDYGQNDIDSDKFELNFKNIDKKQFKIQKRKLGGYPRLFITYPRMMNERIFVNIVEVNKSGSKQYSIEMDLKGNIIDYCKTDYIKVIIH